MGDRHRNLNHKWDSQQVQVGPPFIETTFIGKKLWEQDVLIPLHKEDLTGGKAHSLYCTLYLTPEEGYKLHIEECVVDAREAQPGPPYPVIELVRKTLYSEEEAKQQYPKIFEELLEKAQKLL